MELAHYWRAVPRSQLIDRFYEYVSIVAPSGYQVFYPALYTTVELGSGRA